MKGKLTFIAIGGNSLIKSSDQRSVEDQHDSVRQTIEHVADLIQQGYHVVISHGNGPQVGFIMRRSEVARQTTGLHLVPMVNAVADTQGSIGYQIQQSLNNELQRRSITGQCVTVVTQVVVDGNDPGFENPAKPVGEFFTEEQLPDIQRENPGWTLIPDAGRGYRRAVPCPEPIEVVEKPVIETLLGAGYHVVTAGGGGIPVVRNDNGLEGVDAVIDKDLASSLLAAQLGADLLVISTAVENVYINFGKPEQQALSQITAAEAQEYIRQGHFASGSMLPKIKAGLRFLENGGKRVIITTPESLKQAVINGKGTHIVSNNK
ncbi:MAG: carbamate kinase [Desulfobacteraceae bacterium]|nr:carbamate kinase [Desulfobacteraceae bacterium]